MYLLEGGSANVLGEMIKNCGRWSKIVAVILPEIMSSNCITENIVNKGSGMAAMSTRLNNIWQAGAGGSESKYSFDGLCSLYCIKSILKLHKKTLFFVLD